MEIEDVLRKIKSCLDLSKSSNENESAIALKQAYFLMKKYNVSLDQVQYSNVERISVEVDSTIRKDWLTSLVTIIERAFIVKAGYIASKRTIAFYGEKINCELAEYAFISLYKQAKFSRKNYLDTKLRRFKRANKTIRADTYALGWVSAVRGVVDDFITDNDLEKQKQLGSYVEEKFLKGTLKKINQKEASDNRDYFYGKDDGLKAKIFKGVNRNESKRIE